MTKKQFWISFIFAFLFPPLATWAVISSQDYSVYFDRTISIGSVVGFGGSELVQTFGLDIGAVFLSGGDFSVGGVGSQTVNKLEDELSKAHCYPNPFKPSLGHTRITFSRLTAHTKLKVFNIAGELVYETEVDTPLGELAWDVTNNFGQKLASDLYIYLITDNNGHKATGKFAVIK